MRAVRVGVVWCFGVVCVERVPWCPVLFFKTRLYVANRVHQQKVIRISIAVVVIIFVLHFGTTISLCSQLYGGVYLNEMQTVILLAMVVSGAHTQHRTEQEMLSPLCRR